MALSLDSEIDRVAMDDSGASDVVSGSVLPYERAGGCVQGYQFVGISANIDDSARYDGSSPDFSAYLVPPVQRAVGKRYGIDIAIVGTEVSGVAERRDGFGYWTARPEVPPMLAGARVERVNVVIPRSDKRQSFRPALGWSSNPNSVRLTTRLRQSQHSEHTRSRHKMRNRPVRCRLPRCRTSCRRS